jgi:hypothetical protein
LSTSGNLAMTFGEDDLLANYLLHRLSEAEREAVRERLFLEPDLFERMREVETDLIDALAAGRLSPEDAAAVTQFAAATGQEDRVEFSRALARQPLPATAATRYRTPFWIAAAAAAVFAAGSIVLLTTRRDTSVTPVARSHATIGAQVIAIDLLPVTRGAGSLQSIAVPQGAAFVNVRIASEPGFTRFVISLRRGASLVWAEDVPAEAALQFVVPATVLTPGRYEITTQGQRPDGTREITTDTDIAITR